MARRLDFPKRRPSSGGIAQSAGFPARHDARVATKMGLTLLTAPYPKSLRVRDELRRPVPTLRELIFDVALKFQIRQRLLQRP
jgi:hypothetical protein